MMLHPLRPKLVQWESLGIRVWVQMTRFEGRTEQQGRSVVDLRFGEK